MTRADQPPLVTSTWPTVGQQVTDWTTCRVVRDRDGELWFRGCDSDSMWTANTDYPDVSLGPDEVVAVFGPPMPVLDADGLPVVHTVGDLTARHIGKWVRVQRFEGVLSGIFATSVRPVSLHLHDDAGALWIVSPESELTLDTPCEVLP